MLKGLRRIFCSLRARSLNFWGRRGGYGTPPILSSPLIRHLPLSFSLGANWFSERVLALFGVELGGAGGELRYLLGYGV